MAVASWQIPCKPCFEAGKVSGFTLTLDGFCDSCWRGGKKDFQQKVKCIREQLKKDMQAALTQKAFFNAYSNAKAAGISEGVIKKLCEQFHGRGKVQSAPEEGSAAPSCKRRRSSKSQSSSSAGGAGKMSGVSTVNVVVGLSGVEVTVEVDPDVSVDDLRSKVRHAYSGAEDRFIKFSSGGVVVRTGKAILECSNKGETIFAALLKHCKTPKELQQELCVDNDEFLSHFHILRHYTARNTPADVAFYLWDNQILLTANQAQRIFDALVNKISRAPNPGSLGRNGPRAQLILALHSFCAEPYAIWEPNDDCDECLWANMRWGDRHGGDRGRYSLRGRVYNIPTSSSSDDDPAFQRTDISNLKAVLDARRDDKATPLAWMTFLEAYDYSWRSMITGR